MRIAVTGGSGKLGQHVVRRLRESGHDVVVLDTSGDRGTGWIAVDLTDYGQVVDTLAGSEAVVHLANIPAPGLHPPAHTLTTNLAMNANVFLAAVQLQLSRVVWASSETTLGLPFDVPPRYAPVDEDHYPVPTSTYALSKVASETLAEQIAGWSGRHFIALRFSNIFTPEDYAILPEAWAEPNRRKWNLWGYIDVRDAAQSCRLALTAPVTGAVSVVIAAADTVMPRPSAELLHEVFPGVELTREISEFETLLAIDRARTVLGFEPQHSWRDHLES